MKAILFNEYGGPEVLREAIVAIPEAEADELLIKVAATSFNPVDASIRAGEMKAFLPIALPLITGLDVSGIVEKTGANVSGFHIGDHVYALLDMTKNGAAAGYVRVKAADVARAPVKIPLTNAASLPAVATTAWQALFEHADLQIHQRILITAASGAVGTIAVQLAKWKGAYVVGTASEKHLRYLKELGADQALDYEKDPAGKVSGGRFDVILNLAPSTAADMEELIDSLSPQGILISATTAPDQEYAAQANVRAIHMTVKRNAASLTKIADLVDSGNIQPKISDITRLEKLPQIHKDYQNGLNHGKVVVLVDDRLL